MLELQEERAALHRAHPNNPALAASSAWQERCAQNAFVAPARLALLLNTDVKVRWDQDTWLKASWHRQERQAQSKAGGSIPHRTGKCRRLERRRTSRDKGGRKAKGDGRRADPKTVGRGRLTCHQAASLGRGAEDIRHSGSSSPQPSRGLGRTQKLSFGYPPTHPQVLFKP